MPPKLELPTLQNWSCHNCGGCCRQHEIEITAEERQRIEQQGWQPEQLAGHAGAVVEPLPARGGVARWRLAHRADGACVFLDERGLCRIHARYGEPAKPLACRVYPFAFHPAGDRVVVGFRYSCPSVVSNRGATAIAQRGDLEQLYRLVVPANAGTIAPPAFRPGLALSWSSLRELGRELDRLLTRPAAPLPLRLLWCLGVLDLLNARSNQELEETR
ncbi:MAG: YkgJ family cysteine cluster protein, partial [Planctomycetaceae bacterium]